MSDDQQRIPCESCGAQLEFKPGTATLKCPYCEHEMEIEQAEDIEIEELDFHAFLGDAAAQEDQEEVTTRHCDACGAEVTLDEHVSSDDCPFCGSTISAPPHAQKAIKPRSLLPFGVSRDTAIKSFRDWLKKLWFAPNKVKKYAQLGAINGVYVPHWTYDFETTTQYTGQRGEDYWTTTTVMVNGKPQTRRVKRTRWYSARGTVYNSFDDILILASKSLPKKHAEQLEPWDLDNLVPYTKEYLSGFRVESYQVDLADGFTEAQEKAEPAIRASIRRDIGGDHQRIHSMFPRYDDITFKHLLLPVWLCAYRYRDKVYRFLVNARTGEVQGERPWSWVKITLASLAVAAVIAGIVFYVRTH